MTRPGRLEVLGHGPVQGPCIGAVTPGAETQLACPPRVTEFTRPFWDGLAAGVLRTTRFDFVLDKEARA